MDKPPRHKTILVLWSDQKLDDSDISELVTSDAPVRRVVLAGREKVASRLDPEKDEQFGDADTTLVDRDKEQEEAEAEDADLDADDGGYDDDDDESGAEDDIGERFGGLHKDDD